MQLLLAPRALYKNGLIAAERELPLLRKAREPPVYRYGHAFLDQSVDEDRSAIGNCLRCGLRLPGQDRPP